MVSWRLEILRPGSLARRKAGRCRIYFPLAIGRPDPERASRPAIASPTMPRLRWEATPCQVEYSVIEHLENIDSIIDELLVQLGQMVKRLSHPQITRTHDERAALARSVHQFTVCAATSRDPRVTRLAEELEDTLKPRLRLVASR